MILTFVDAGVLIAAATLRNPNFAEIAIAILDDPNRSFIASGFLRIEVLPKAAFHHRGDEVAFYQQYFRRARLWTPSLDDAIRNAEGAARQWGLNAMDALYVAAAIDMGVEEFVTTERSTTPLHRVSSLRVTGILSHNG